MTKKIGLELTDESFDEPDSSNQPEMFVLRDKNIIEIRKNLDKGNNETSFENYKYAYLPPFDRIGGGGEGGGISVHLPHHGQTPLR